MLMKSGRTRVLVVEDEQDIAGLIKHALERESSMEVEIAASGDAALRSVTEAPPDLVILDLNLPILSGIEVCRIIRGRPETAKVPIIMLTARTTESDRIAGLDVGADDYITKPFSLRELAARVRAVLRRRSNGDQDSTTPVYRGKHIVADFEAVAIAVDGEPIRLTRREFEFGCSSVCGDTTRRSKRDRWTCTWGASAESYARRDSRLKPWWAWATASSSDANSAFATRHARFLGFVPAAFFEHRRFERERHPGTLDAVPVMVADPANHMTVALVTDFPTRFAS
jgi:DNA-binding response OmpR family regulator